MVSVHVPNCKSSRVTEAGRKHVRRRARFQQHREAIPLQAFILPGNAQKEIQAILTETSEEHAPLHATVKNWRPSLNDAIYLTYFASRPGRHKTVTSP
jgi:hypothetical protein